MTVSYRCTTCGARAEGSPDDLYKRGWRRRTTTKNRRDKTITACPQHADVMRVELGGGE